MNGAGFGFAGLGHCAARAAACGARRASPAARRMRLELGLRGLPRLGRRRRRRHEEAEGVAPRREALRLPDEVGHAQLLDVLDRLLRASASTARRGVAPATPGGAPSAPAETPESLSGRRYQPLSRTSTPSTPSSIFGAAVHQDAALRTSGAGPGSFGSRANRVESVRLIRSSEPSGDGACATPPRPLPCRSLVPGVRLIDSRVRNESDSSSRLMNLRRLT